jgi:hypothetical protein
LAEDAEEMATARAVAGQPATFDSLCSVLVVDGRGNAQTLGWEEKFLSVADAQVSDARAQLA